MNRISNSATGYGELGASVAWLRCQGAAACASPGRCALELRAQKGWSWWLVPSPRLCQRMNVLLGEHFRPNPRLVTKSRLRVAVSVPAAHLHPKAGLAVELELEGSFPREKVETPFGGGEGICFWKSRAGRGGFLWCLSWSTRCWWHWQGGDVALLPFSVAPTTELRPGRELESPVTSSSFGFVFCWAQVSPRVVDTHKVPVAAGTCFCFCCECKAWSPLPAAPAAPGAAMHVLVLSPCSFG